MDEALCQAKHDALKEVNKISLAVLEERLNGMDQAVKVKTEEMERRLEGLNELRSEVIQDRTMLVRQDVYKPKMLMLDYSC